MTLAPKSENTQHFNTDMKIRIIEFRKRNLTFTPANLPSHMEGCNCTSAFFSFLGLVNNFFCVYLTFFSFLHILVLHMLLCCCAVNM